MKKCIACPVATGSPCLGETPRFVEEFCDWAATGDPVKVRHIINRSAIAGGTAHVADAAPRPPSGRIPVAESMRRLKAARECPNRTDPQCGCIGWATCLLGRGEGGQVSLSECVTCVAEASPAMAGGEHQ